MLKFQTFTSIEKSDRAFLGYISQTLIMYTKKWNFDIYCVEILASENSFNTLIVRISIENPGSKILSYIKTKNS